MATKADLRARALRARDATDPAVRSEASRRIAAGVRPLLDAAAPEVLAAYVAMRSEVDPHAIVAEAERRGIAVVLPAIVPGAGLVFRRHRPGTALVAAGFGTREPPDHAPVHDPDSVIVPLVAFDRSGMRLGYGKGYYDTAIAGLRARGPAPLLIGVAFSVQEVDTIPHEPHDVRLDVIVTERETLDFRTRGRDRP